MKKLSYFSISVLLTGLVVVSALYGAAKWQKVKSDDGITVFTRDVKGSDLDEFMGVTYINKHISVLLALLDDIPAQTQWMKDCINAKLIYKKGDFYRIVYNATHAPWPVTNRDVVVKTVLKLHQKKGMAVVSIKNTTDSRAPVKKGIVRMPGLTGSWTLCYMSDTRTKVIYRINANIGGSVPATLANMTAKDIPFGTLKGMKKMVNKPKYTAEGKKLFAKYGKGWNKYKE